MSETLIYLIIFAAIIFFMHRGHGHGTGGCGGHSHKQHKGHNHCDDESNINSEKRN